MGKIIEFTGMPAAGKSTQIELLVKELVRLGKTFTLFNERELGFDGNFFEFNRKTYLNLLGRYRAWKNTPTDYLILDRGFNDRLVWPFADYEAGYCLEEQKEELIKLAFENERPFIDHVFLMMIPPEETISRRIKPQLPIDEFVINSTYLPILHKSYTKLLEELLPKQTVVIDGMGSIEEKQKEISRYLFQRKVNNLVNRTDI